jgi:hypothetical protein
LIACAAAAALWMLFQFERGRRLAAGGKPGISNFLEAFSRESVPLGAVAVVSVLGLLPNVRERLGGIVDLVVRLIG